jgi:hypothetical protein
VKRRVSQGFAPANALRGGSWARNAIGHWELHVATAGRYDVRLEFEANPEKGNAELKFAGVSKSMAFAAGAKFVEFKGVRLAAGDTQLRAVLSHNGKSRGVYQVVVTRR